jgi:hypothetical protein
MAVAPFSAAEQELEDAAKDKKKARRGRA